MYVEKRNGSRVGFEFEKVKSAVERAFAETGEKYNAKKLFKALKKNIDGTLPEYGCGVYTVEQIQDIVETTLMEQKYYDTAKAYVRYRYQHELARQKKNDNEFLSMLEGNNDYWTSENSNKNPKVVTVQRDYLAGIASTDIARNYIFPKNLIEAHDNGLIHIHDMDYAAQQVLTNCCLINLDDMLQNGTVINGVAIDKPHRLITAMTIATQVIASVASSQFGGCTITLTHLAPFVRDSFNQHRAAAEEELLSIGYNHGDELDQATYVIAQKRTHKEISDAVQTMNYQLNSLATTNGQSPFVSVTMYLGETDEYKNELAMLIEEVLRQRIQGMKNRVGVPVTMAFPKLLYVLEEDNISEKSPYWHLTELAAKCTAKRMVPDYISEKMMKQLKLSKGETPGQGDCYPCIN